MRKLVLLLLVRRRFRAGPHWDRSPLGLALLRRSLPLSPSRRCAGLAHSGALRTRDGRHSRRLDCIRAKAYLRPSASRPWCSAPIRRRVHLPALPCRPATAGVRQVWQRCCRLAVPDGFSCGRRRTGRDAVGLGRSLGRSALVPAGRRPMAWGLARPGLRPVPAARPGRPFWAPTRAANCAEVRVGMEGREVAWRPWTGIATGFPPTPAALRLLLLAAAAICRKVVWSIDPGRSSPPDMAPLTLRSVPKGPARRDGACAANRPGGVWR